MKKPMTINIDMNSTKLEAQLRAISKHTKALADELCVINAGDVLHYPECGRELYVETYYNDAKPVVQMRQCPCGYRKAVNV